MDADDLGRMLGWEFSLMTAAVRLINPGCSTNCRRCASSSRILPAASAAILAASAAFSSAANGARPRWARHGRQPPQAVRPLSRSSVVLRYRRLGRSRSAGRVGRRLGEVRLAGIGVLAARLCDRLSAGGARSRRGHGLCRGDPRRSAPMAARSPTASMPKNSFPILLRRLGARGAKLPPRLKHERYGASGGMPRHSIRPRKAGNKSPITPRSAIWSGRSGARKKTGGPVSDLQSRRSISIVPAICMAAC